MKKFFSAFLLIMLIAIFSYATTTDVVSDSVKELKIKEEKTKEYENEKSEEKNEVEKKVENTQSELREKILNDFKEKLTKNTNGIQKTKIESIDDEFAIIIEKRNQDKLRKNAERNKEQLNKDVMELATKPIKNEQSEEAKAFQKGYVNLIQEEIKKQEKKQQEQIDEINKSIEKEIEKELTKTNKDTTKNNDNKGSTARIENKKNINKTEEKYNDKFDLTDTGVTEELIYADKFQKMIEDYKIDLVIDSNKKDEVTLLVPQEKKLSNFDTEDIPEELLSDVRSIDNRHIPHILTVRDFQNTARQAINKGDLDTVRGIVNLTKNPNYILNNGQTMLNYASSLNDMNITKYLVFNGANPNVQNLLGNAALHNAILRNNLEMVKLLVKNNANLEMFNIDGYTPLMLSIIEGRSDITLYLLKFNQNLLLKNYKGETVLDIAIKYNRIVIKELILEIISEESL